MKIITEQEIQEAAEHYTDMQYPMGVEREYPINDFTAGVKWLQEQQGWISVNDKLPEAGDKVLIVIDVRKWDDTRKLRIESANVGIFDEPTLIGGPNSLTGYKRIEGIYFAIPAIMHPDAVTYWMPLPELP